MRICFALILALVLTSLGCRTTNYTQQGAQVGGLGGAGVGALLGELAADSPLAGAAIGGSLGALTGASMGAGLDEVDASQRAQQVAYAQAVESGVTLGEVVTMANAGLSDDIIARHVRENGFWGTLGATDLISLRQQGVSDRVIAELQTLSHRGAGPAVSPDPVLVRPSAPVVVEEHHYVAPFAPACPPIPRGVRFHRRHPAFHWGVSFGN